MRQFVPYRPEHFLQMVPTEGDTGFMMDASARFHADYPASTYMVDDTPVASFGITPLWDGVAEVWAVFDDRYIRDHGVMLVRSTKQFLDDLSEKYHRLQCFVFANNERLKKFVETFGFEQEGLMKKYGPTGDDFYLYARVS